jgi:outer membrane immunogenic protein
VFRARNIIVLLTFLEPLGIGPPALAETDWSGFYAGGMLGRPFIDTNWETTCVGITCPDAGGVFAGHLKTENPYEFEDTSTRYGAFAGVQLQMASFVVGIEGDYGRAHNQSAASGIPGAEMAGLGDNGPDSADVRIDWDASIRARAGYLLTPQLLVFATVGKAWVKQETAVSCSIAFPSGWCSPENVGKTAGDSEVIEGWTWGTGLEALLDGHWMLRVEYRRSEFERMDSTYFEGVLHNADRINASTDTQVDTISIGLAYNF